MAEYIIEAGNRQDILDGKYAIGAELIRCEECKWKYGSTCIRFSEVYIRNIDFCSRGERKKDGKS